MPAASFDFDSMGIGTLLKKVLAVPPNQRSYSWRKEMVTDFLRDIHLAISEDDPNYFLGTIVLVETPSGIPEIADGQQRLATAAIALARIRDLMKSLGKEAGATSLDQEFLRKYDDETETYIQRLKLNDSDNAFFASSILAAPSDPGYDPLPAERRSNRRLLQASEAIATYLNNMIQLDQPTTRAQTLIRWRKFLESSAFVIVVTAENEVGAYRIFETLNDRGLRASQTDILKNYLFSKAGTRLKEAQTVWGEMAAAMESPLVLDEEEQEGGALLTYLRHFWITTHGPTRSSELAAQIKAEIGGQSKAIQFLSNANAAVQDYIALGSSKHPKWAKYSASVRRNVDTIAEHLQIKQIKPLLFAVALRFSPTEAEKAFKLFVSWSVRFLIFGGRGGMLDEQYARRAKEVGTKQITKASELRNEMKKYVPTDAEFEDAFANARVSRQRLARYYLRAIEKTKVGDQQPEYIANEDIQDISLEHIMPLKPGSDWDIEDELAEASQKRLGNMVLLKANQNRDLGNRPFKEKRETYSESGYLSTKEVADYEDWSLDQIKERQSKMAKLAVKTWGLTFDE